MLYLLYLIIWHKYKEFKINVHIEHLTINNVENKQEVINKKKILSYLSTNAYTDYMLKDTRWLRNKWEVIIVLNKKKENFNKINLTKYTGDLTIVFETNLDKWIFFLFKKEKSINY